MMRETAIVKFGGNFCFGTINSPLELRSDEASDTLGVPSNFCTAGEGLGTFTIDNLSLSYVSTRIPYWFENSSRPLTFASRFIEEIFLMLLEESLLSLKTVLMPVS